VTEREPLWTDEDRAWLQAYLAELDEVCPGCGNPLDECRDPRTARTWRVITDTCQACLVAEAEADNRAEAARDTGARQRGLYQAVVRS
jgi:hypothetical protein